MSKAFLPVAVYSVWQKGPTRKRVDINRVRYMKCLASRQLYEGEIVLILQLKELDAAQGESQCLNSWFSEHCPSILPGNCLVTLTVNQMCTNCRLIVLHIVWVSHISNHKLEVISIHSIVWWFSLKFLWFFSFLWRSVHPAYVCPESMAEATRLSHASLCTQDDWVCLKYPIALGTPSCQIAFDFIFWGKMITDSELSSFWLQLSFMQHLPPNLWSWPLKRRLLLFLPNFMSANIYSQPSLHTSCLPTS